MNSKDQAPVVHSIQRIKYTQTNTSYPLDKVEQARPRLRMGTNCRGVLENYTFWSEKGEGLENRAIHPHEKFRGVPSSGTGYSLSSKFYPISNAVLRRMDQAY